MSWSGFLPKNAIVMARKGPEQGSEIEHLSEEPQQAETPHESAGVQETPLITSSARVLVFLETEPSPVQRDLLRKMMNAISIAETDYQVEWGDFPSTSYPFVLGLGLGSKKSSRLAALRPDGFTLPSLAEIASDPVKKREAWLTLQRVENFMRTPR